MESWARQGAFPGVAFLCVSTDMNVRMASFAAMSFAKKLQMTAAINSYGLRRPESGQLGCSGFVILKPQDASILIRATPSYLQYGPKAHRWVEEWLSQQQALPKPVFQWQAQPPQPQISLPDPSNPPAQQHSACKTCNLGACSKDSSSAAGTHGSTKMQRKEVDAEHANGSSGKVSCQGTLKISLAVPKLASVGHAEMDAEHQACTQALAIMLERPSQESAARVLAVLQDHFQHEEQVMRVSGFGGQGPLSGFQSHCNHHQVILDHFQSVRDMLPPKTQHAAPVSGAASSAVQQAVHLFYSHADMYDLLYEGKVHG